MSIPLSRSVVLLGAVLLLVAPAAMWAADGAYVHEGPSLRAPGSVDALSGSRTGTLETIARDFLEQRVGELGLVDGDLAQLEITSSNVTAHTQVGHVYFQQVQSDIPVFGAVANVNVAADGRVLSVGNRLLPDLESAVNQPVPTLGAVSAAEAALLHLDHETGVAVRRSKDDARRHTTLTSGGVTTGDVAARLTWLPVSKVDVRLTWEIEAHFAATANAWQIFVDAHTGEVLHKIDLVVHDEFGPNPGGLIAGTPVVDGKAAGTTVLPSLERTPVAKGGAGAQYEVFEMPAEYPYENNDPTTPADDVDPADPDGGRSVVVDPDDDTASPFGWHDTDGTPAPSSPSPRATTSTPTSTAPTATPRPGQPARRRCRPRLHRRAGAARPDQRRPTAYGPASVVNLFYWNNIIHDVFYRTASTRRRATSRRTTSATAAPARLGQRRGPGRQRHQQRQLRHAVRRLEPAHADVHLDRAQPGPRRRSSTTASSSTSTATASPTA